MIAGYIGVLTGLKPGKFAITVDERDPIVKFRFDIRPVLATIKRMRDPSFSLNNILVRDVFE